jgi:competence ComEA-like helix-hairpin-helix protein
MFFVNAPVVTPPNAPDSPRPLWPPAAQVAAGIILSICVVTLGWTGYQHRHTFAGSPFSNDYVIDLNRADHAELLQLPGVGESLAGRIEAYRDEHGPFQTVLELRRVHGIGPVTLARLSPYVGTNMSPAAAPARGRALNGEGGKASTRPERRTEENAAEDQDQGDKP